MKPIVRRLIVWASSLCCGLLLFGCPNGGQPPAGTGAIGDVSWRVDLNGRDALPGDGASDAELPPGMVCWPGQLECQGTGYHRCQADGLGFGPVLPCPPGHPCRDGQCEGICSPACDGKQCGDDGCGSTCGTCPADCPCSASGQCQCGCESDCNGKQCGDDGCGQSCGICPTGTACVQGRCQVAAFPCLGFDEQETCCRQDNPCNWAYDGFCDCEGNCDWDWSDCQCTPDCTYRECGDNGCGGSCGECDWSDCVYEYPYQYCEYPCIPDCSQQDCGYDPICGQSCGECDWSYSCVNGRCQYQGEPCPGYYDEDPCCLLNDPCGWARDGYCDCSGTCAWDQGDCGCIPDCTYRSCGDDGCGGSCGDCPPDSYCTNEFMRTYCTPVCVSDCTYRECGGDGCHGTCGQCPEGYTCVYDHPYQYCEFGCTPDCTNRECGDDGCGGSCGDCPEGFRCTYDPVPEVFQYCICTPDCSHRQCGDDGCGGSCGQCGLYEVCLQDAASAYCTTGCLYDCDNRQCGSDGCGGHCGYCWEGTYCIAGSCQYVTCIPNCCVPDCANSTCGDDGCNGSCGTCPPGYACSEISSGRVCILMADKAADGVPRSP